MKKGVQARFIPGAGLLVSYADVPTGQQPTSPIKNEVASFNKSLLGESVPATVEQIQKAINKARVQNLPGNTLGKKVKLGKNGLPKKVAKKMKRKSKAKKMATGEYQDQAHKTAENENSNDTDELTDRDDDESIEGQSGDTEMAEPNSTRTPAVRDTAGQAATKMAQPNSKRVPAVKESDKPEGPDHPGKTTWEKSSSEPYMRESRVYHHKSHAAGTVRRVTQNDGVLEYSVALDNGAVIKSAHQDIMLMTAEEQSRR